MTNQLRTGLCRRLTLGGTPVAFGLGPESEVPDDQAPLVMIWRGHVPARRWQFVHRGRFWCLREGYEVEMQRSAESFMLLDTEQEDCVRSVDLEQITCGAEAPFSTSLALPTCCGVCSWHRGLGPTCRSRWCGGIPEKFRRFCNLCLLVFTTCCTKLLRPAIHCILMLAVVVVVVVSGDLVASE